MGAAAVHICLHYPLRPLGYQGSDCEHVSEHEVQVKFKIKFKVEVEQLCRFIFVLLQFLILQMVLFALTDDCPWELH